MMISILLFFLMNMPASGHSDYDPCKVYGKIYIESDPSRADYRVYVEDSEAFADIIIYEQENALFADRTGQWAFVEKKNFANAYIYLEKRKNMADFTIAYTDVESFAGCNR